MKTIIAIIAVASATNIQAATSFTFSGTVSSIDNNENSTLGAINIGQTFSGTFSYSLVADTDTSSTRGVYNQNASLNLVLGSNSINYENDFIFIRVGDNRSSEDSFDFAVDNSFDDFNMSYFGFELTDSSETAFSSDALPSSFNVADFDNPLFRLDGSRISSGDRFSLDLQITFIDAIPEPSSSALLAFGMVFVVLRRRK